jgi:hypothetical protein
VKSIQQLSSALASPLSMASAASSAPSARLSTSPEHALDAVALFVKGTVVLDRHTPV